MRYLLATLLFCSACCLAETDKNLIATWKAVPIKVNGETIERDETLIIGEKTYQRIMGAEKRSGNLQIGDAPNNFGRAIILGEDMFQIRLSADGKTLSLYKIIPEHRVQGGTASAQVGPLSMSYERVK